jgi:hypothetical protein
MVFVLFFALLALGYSQRKARAVSHCQVAVLPASMMA